MFAKNESSEVSRWICPNDRSLNLRAKLGTGWSYYSAKSNFSKLSKHEIEHIHEVMKKSAKIEELEQRRIEALANRIAKIKKLASGDGKTQCILCAQNLGLLSFRRICEVCKHCLCAKCGSEVTTSEPDGFRHVLLCKICLEHREFLKRSCDWFYKTTPLCLQDLKEKKSVNENASYEKEVVKTTYSYIRNRNRLGSETDSETDSDAEALTNVLTQRYGTVNPVAEEFSQSAQQISDSANKLKYETSNNDMQAETLTNQCNLSSIQFDSQKETVLQNFQLESLCSTGQYTKQILKAVNVESTKSSDEVIKNTELLKMNQDESTSCGQIQYGSLYFSTFYNKNEQNLEINIKCGKCLKSMDYNGLSDPYVKLHLLPDNGHQTKLRTRTIPHTLNPEWNELLVYRGILPNDLQCKTLRLAVLDEDRFGFDWIGEYRLPLKFIKHDEIQNFEVELEHRKPVNEGQDIFHQSERGKILLGLEFNSHINELRVLVKRCASLIPMDPNGYSDPFVKLYLKHGNNKANKRKTRIAKKTLNPEFNEEFVYNICAKELINSSLEVTVWDYDIGKRNDYIGGIILGNQSKGNSLHHWFKIFKFPGCQHEMWHALNAELRPNSL